MLRLLLIVAGLAAIGLLAGCKGAAPPKVRALAATSLQREWLSRISTATAGGAGGQRLERLLRKKAAESGAQIVSVQVVHRLRRP